MGAPKSFERVASASKRVNRPHMADYRSYQNHTHKQDTSAMGLGFADHVWSVEKISELLG